MASIPAEDPKGWTIMSFIAAQSSLNHAARDGLLQMKQGSTDDFHLIAEFDTGVEGPTRRYCLKPINEALRENIENAREMFAALDKREDSLSLRNLEGPFRELLNEESLDATEIFKRMQMQQDRFNVLVDEDPKLPLAVVFERILPLQQQQERFRANYLENIQNRKKLLEEPPWLIPFLFECLFETDNQAQICPRKAVRKSTSTGDPLVLQRFLEWGIGFQSKYKMVVIKGHGDGFSVAWDATPKNLNESGLELDRLRAVELREAFSIPKKGQPACFEFFDIVGFNACMMGMLEVYHKLRHYVGYGIASEGPTPLASWPFRKILEKLANQPYMLPVDLAETILNDYIEENKKFETECHELVKKNGANEGECSIDLSICDLSYVQDVVDHLERLTDTLINILKNRQEDLPTARKLVAARADSQEYFDGEYVDLSDFCQKLCDQFKGSNEVCQLSNNVIHAVAQLSPDGHHRHLQEAPNSFGLSIYFPEIDFSRSYSLSLQIKEIQWVDFLRAYVKFRKEVRITRKRRNSVTVKWDAADERAVNLKTFQTKNKKAMIKVNLKLLSTKNKKKDTLIKINGRNYFPTLSELKRGQEIILGDAKGIIRRVHGQTVKMETTGRHKQITHNVDAHTEIRIIGIPLRHDQKVATLPWILGCRRKK